jgi:tetratricopeptide (TPR) repeat protein/KaiC/GvpD/RAD55 family RecA-like ATPase
LKGCWRARALLRGNASLAVVRLKARVLAEPVLVGRERELEELMRCLDSAFEGKGTTVFVSGEAGSGKTRITTEFLRLAREKGVAVLAGWCLSNAAVPYFPFVEAFKSYFAATDNERVQNEELEINAWLMGLKQAEKSDAHKNLTPQAWKDLTFAAVTKALLSISAKKTAVLFIEDIQWADSASLSLLHYIARTIGSERVFVLATFRSEELTADAEGHPHPLAEELRLMRREDLFKEIKLPNLNQAYVTEIAENMVGGSVHPELAAKLAKESRGNALFVVESLRMLFERGSLFQENGQWRLSVDALGIPGKFKDIILRRLAVLKFNQRRILDAASVIGEKFDVELLGVVLCQDTLEVLETLNMIAQSTSLVCVEESFFRFDHAKSREAIYEEIPMPLKRGYHARVAERLESTSRGGRLPFSEIAYHYAQAGNREKAMENALLAGQDALAKFSNAEAIKHFAYVLQTTPDVPESAEVRRIALEGLGDAYYANFMFKEALEVFELLAISETDKVRLRAYRKAMDTVYFGKYDPAHLMELAKKAEPYAAFDRLESARIRFHKGGILPLEKENAEFRAALRVFEEEYSLPDIARALDAVGTTRNVLDPYRNGLSEELRSIAIREELGDLRGLMSSMLGAGIALFFYGFFQEAEKILINAIKIGGRIGDYERMSQASLALGRVLERLGRLEEALSANLKAIEYFQKVEGDVDLLRQIFAELVGQYARLGDLKRAEEYYLKLVNLPSAGPHYSRSPEFELFREGLICRAKAAFFTSKNQWKEANQYFEKALEIARARLPPSLKVALRKDIVWALNKQGRTEETKAHLEEIQKINKEIEKRFAQVNIEATLMAPRKVIAGEEFEARLVLINFSRKPGLLVKAHGLIPSEFELTAPLSRCSFEKDSVIMNKRRIDPFQVETVKLKLKAPKAGAFSMNPQVAYTDESGKIKTCRPTPITITVQTPQPLFEALPGRITTGFSGLDRLLLGGIPENFTVILASPSCDERELLIKRFLEVGAKAGEVTLCVTVEAGSTKTLAEECPSNLYLFVCNPQADAMVQNLPNVFKLKGIESLTEIDIALTKAFRTLKPSATGTKRMCIEIVSDVLLQHHAVITRKWLSALLPNLKSRGFTVLAVINPQMHPQEEVQAILGLFDGEIGISEKEAAKGREKVLQIRRLHNQKYLEDELILTKEKLEQ